MVKKKTNIKKTDEARARITPVMARRLEEYCEAEGIDHSTAVRQAIDHLLKSVKPCQ